MFALYIEHIRYTLTGIRGASVDSLSNRTICTAFIIREMQYLFLDFHVSKPGYPYEGCRSGILWKF